MNENTILLAAAALCFTPVLLLWWANWREKRKRRKARKNLIKSEKEEK
jgi:preprotein translocase subunit YajC